MTDVHEQTRVLRTLTGPAEKRLLIWLAQRMPAWVTPDLLTFVGVLGAIIVFVGYWLSHVSPAFLWLATAGLVVNWFGDSVDGTLARVRHIERPRYGFYIDHTVDVISEGLIILGIGASQYVHWQYASLVFIGYLAMSVLAYVRAFVDGVFKISYSRIGPTELRIVIVGLNVAMLLVGPMHYEGFFYMSPFDILLCIVAAVLGAAFLISMLKGARELAHIDTDSQDRAVS